VLAVVDWIGVLGVGSFVLDEEQLSRAADDLERAQTLP
jgi:hypothetical protein